MSNLPLVSVVTPTRNQAAFIPHTLRSIQDQTYGHLEHIVIDAGSTDETLDILLAYNPQYPVRWTSEPDGGMYDGINKGFRLATGDILCYLNSDDLFFPWTLETVVSTFEAHPEADFVIGDALGLGPDGCDEIRFQPALPYSFLLYGGSLVQPAVFWRRTVLDAGVEFDTSLQLAGDLDFWLRATRGRTVVRAAELLAVERDHGLTKRARQWDALLSEASAIRTRAGADTRTTHLTMMLVERFRAWTAKRRLWLEFAVAIRARSRRPGDPWAHFLAADRVRIDAARFTLGQVPWLGRHVLPGVLTMEHDWGDRSEA